MRIRLLAVLLTLVGAAAGILFAAKAAAAIGDSVMVFNMAAPPQNFSPAYTAKVERAVEQQVLEQVRQEWDVPQIVFAPGTTGVQVWFLPQPVTNQVCGQVALGCHGQEQGGELDIAVALGSRKQETNVFDHEALETAKNPDTRFAPALVASGPDAGEQEEICDPVNGAGYWFDGVWLSRFVGPGYFKQPLT